MIAVVSMQAWSKTCMYIDMTKSCTEKLRGPQSPLDMSSCQPSLGNELKAAAKNAETAPIVPEPIVVR